MEHKELSQLEQELWMHVYTLSLRRCMKPVSEIHVKNDILPDETKWLDWAQKRADDAVRTFKMSKFGFCNCKDCEIARNT